MTRDGVTANRSLRNSRDWTRAAHPTLITDQSMESSRFLGLIDVISNCWDLGFNAFGGPPTHFQILHKRFVERLKWIDEDKVHRITLLYED